MLREWHHLPDGFLEAGPEDLAALLGGPSLIHLAGRREPALFLSVLLHGNETTGLSAVQAVLGHYGEQKLPRSLSLFVGNVAAAVEGVRRLDGQPDYNRIWPGGDAADSDERAMAAEVVAIMRRRGCFASIDIHNNTGVNPHYGCVNYLEPAYLYLATLFSPTVVYFTQPRGVQSLAFGAFCPAVTVECGKAGSEHALHHARELIDSGLHLQAIPDHPARDRYAVFHTVGIVRVRPEVRFGFEPGADLTLMEDLESMNFTELPAGTAIGEIGAGGADMLPVSVVDNDDNPVAEDYFEVEDGVLRTRRKVVPAMFTRDERVIRQDCLCYFMEAIDPGL
ncbi:succinylglutamate desuccinylase/aspartoacylase family protein [Ectothiorhodospiraceae bacterium WFHF3C12]|nr:succinylglutamate desuccinylase/aspartoacylase family protein [Ectothiorhodospiraceae bacterium WFHF3C12]